MFFHPHFPVLGQAQLLPFLFASSNLVGIYSKVPHLEFPLIFPPNTLV